MTTAKTKQFDATFEITEWTEDAYDEPAEGPKLTHVTIRKRYFGVIDGHSVARVLTTQGPDGSGYVVSERVTGTFDGRTGTFVIQHGGLMDPANQETFGQIVPGSGTGELEGLRGRAVEAAHEVLTLIVEQP